MIAKCPKYGVALLIGFLLCLPVIPTVRADSMQITEEERLMDLALSYLYTNYSNDNIGLIRNSGDAEFSNIYWLYSDNYLAVQVLSTCSRSNSSHVDMADDIESAIGNYTRDYLAGIDPVNMYRMFTENMSAFKGSRAVNLNVPDLPSGVVVNTTVSDGGDLSSREYTDIAFLKVIYNSTWGDKNHVLDEYQYGVNSWNSSNDAGFEDTPFTTPSSRSYGRYQTYKLALFIYASKLLAPEYHPCFYQRAYNTLLSMNLTYGGFATEYKYDSDLQEVYALSGTNTETTCLAVLAFDKQSSDPIPEFHSIVIPVLSVVTVLVAMRRIAEGFEPRKRP